MKTGDSILIKATVLRVEGSRLDAQTADGQLIQTDVSNVMTEEKQTTAKKEEKQTRIELETTPVKFCAIYPLVFEDVPENRQDEPLIKFTYEFYLFHERTSARADESITPDVFNKKLLKTHSDFIRAWLDLRSEFLGEQKLNLGADFSVAKTNSLLQTEEINNDGRCEFVPGLKGFEVKMHLVATILIKEC